jgi:hypothetical protein
VAAELFQGRGDAGFAEVVEVEACPDGSGGAAMYLCWWRTCGLILAATVNGRGSWPLTEMVACGTAIEAFAVADGVVGVRMRSTVSWKLAGSMSACQVTVHVPGSASPGPDETCPPGMVRWASSVITQCGTPCSARSAATAAGRRRR